MKSMCQRLFKPVPACFFLLTLLLVPQSALTATHYGISHSSSPTESWVIFDNHPRGASVAQVFDAERKRMVTKLTGQSTKNGFMIGSYRVNAGWNNDSEFIAHWSTKSTAHFSIYFSTETDDGHRHIVFNSADGETTAAKRSVRSGLGKESRDGQWHDYRFDLAEMLRSVEPDNRLRKVNGVLVRGNTLIDGIHLDSGDAQTLAQSTSPTNGSASSRDQAQTAPGELEKQVIVVEISDIQPDSPTSTQDFVSNLAGQTDTFAADPDGETLDTLQLGAAMPPVNPVQDYRLSSHGYGTSDDIWNGARVVFVDKLSDTPGNPLNGELRYALNVETGPRIIVFKVGGTIKTNSTLFIREKDSNVYIAGQTAPGDGITIRARNPAEAKDLIRLVDAQNVSLNFLRLRLGKNNTPGTGDNLSIISSSNIDVNHVSLSWSNDENLGMWTDENASLSNITVQNSLLSEPLSPHSTNLLMTSKPDFSNPDNPHHAIKGIKRISMHRNVFTHASHRNPRILGLETLVANNVIYNWSEFALGTLGNTEMDFRNNFLLEGPNALKPRYHIFAHQSFTFDNKNPPADRYDINDPKVYYMPNGSIFHDGNRIDYFDSTKVDGEFNEWENYVERIGLGNHFYKCDGSDSRCLTNNARYSALPDSSSAPYTVVPADDGLLEQILDAAGASRGLDCQGRWRILRDDIDQRVIADIRARRIADAPESPADVGGYVETTSGSPCADSDNDGMPDAFELNNSLDAGLNDAFADLDGDGITNLEEYLSGTLPAGE